MAVIWEGPMKLRNTCILFVLLSTLFSTAFAQSLEMDDFDSDMEVEESVAVEPDSSASEPQEDKDLFEEEIAE